MPIIAIANRKGGVGKTTVTLNLAAELAELGHRVLAVDNDSQCNLTTGLRFERDPSRGLYQVLIQRAPAEQVIERYHRDRGRKKDSAQDTADNGDFDVLLGSPALNVAEQFLATEVSGREFRLAEALSTIRDRYDFILIDCAPSLGLLTVNAVVAADAILVAVETQQWAYEAIPEVQEIVTKLRRYNPNVRITDIVPTKYVKSTGHDNAILEALVELGRSWPDGPIRVHAPISYNARLKETSSTRQPLRDYDRNSTAADAFALLAARISEAFMPVGLGATS